MKDLVGPRRRMPAELWSLIFWERVMEDEEEFEESDRYEPPPFTTLKLTWVCRLWRQIVTQQPALWSYITILPALYLSSKHCERLNFFKERLKGHLPTVYMGEIRDGPEKEGVHLGSILRIFNAIETLELRVTTKASDAERLLGATSLHINVLCLNPSFQRRLSTGTKVMLSYDAVSNIKTIKCYDSKAANKASWTASTWRDAKYTRTKRSTSLKNAVLKIFNGRIFLPQLRRLSVSHRSSEDVNEMLRVWSSFLTKHRRGDTISELTICDPRTRSPPDSDSVFGKVISWTPKICSLKLTGSCITPALKGLVNSGNIPSGLIQLDLRNSVDVMEDDVHTFLIAFYGTKRDKLSIAIQECNKISAVEMHHLNISNDNLSS
ncbi:hypothetical protein CPB86DRAFT_838768 [Serendipita vermifera]|nr:hypothetical protein CPB86DRAFT_838768 [Serendipita vermifera]